MPDVVIAQPAVVSTPAVYTIAGAQAFELLSVQAAYDGSGAGGAFLPALQLVDPGGHVMATATASSVAAGGSAAISWFPGVGTQSAGTDADDYVLLDEEIVTLGGTTAITFASINQTYRHLVLYLSVGNGGGANFTTGSVRFTINSGITSYNYRSYSNYTLSASSVTSVGTFIEMTNAAPPAPAGGNLNNHGWGQFVLVFPYYALASRNPTVTWEGSAMASLLSGSGDTGVAVAATGPLTDLNFTLVGGGSSSFTVGSHGALYGVR